MFSNHELFRFLLIGQSLWLGDVLKDPNATECLQASTVVEAVDLLKRTDSICLILLQSSLLQDSPERIVGTIKSIANTTPLVVFGSDIEEPEALRYIRWGVAEVIALENDDEFQKSLIKRTIARVLQRQEYNSLLIKKVMQREERLLPVADVSPNMPWTKSSHCKNVSGAKDYSQHGDRKVTGNTAGRSHNTVDMAPIGILNLDNQLIIRRVNKYVAKIFAIPKENFVGKHVLEVIDSFNREIFEQVQLSGEEVQFENYNALLKNCDSQDSPYFDIAIWPMLDRHRQSTGLGMSLIEVTARKRIEQQKEDFVATLVHDLKSPLIGANRTLEALLDGAVGEIDSEQSAILCMLKSSNLQLLAMVQNLIEVYRFDAGKLKFSLESISAHELITETMEELAALAQGKNICLSQSLPASLSNFIGDRVAIRRVFQNLLDNAIKFTSRCGVVKIFAEEETDSIAVHIRDTGDGIPLEEQSQLFKRFSQGASGRRHAVGTGLGLYLCKQIVEAHNGQLTFSSKETEGTTLSVRLPKYV